MYFDNLCTDIVLEVQMKHVVKYDVYLDILLTVSICVVMFTFVFRLQGVNNSLAVP